MRIVLDTNSLIQSILQQLAGEHTAEMVLDAIVRSNHVLFFTPQFRFNLITVDPDDNKFVYCAIQANARYIVTNDKHYDVLRQIDFPKVGVIKLMEFLLMIHG